MELMHQQDQLSVVHALQEVNGTERHVVYASQDSTVQQLEELALLVMLELTRYQTPTELLLA